MVKRNGSDRSIGRISVLAVIAGLVASAALALGNDGPSREEVRLIEMRVMNVYGVNYGTTDWSAVTRQLAANPDAAGNTAIMSIPLALGNVYLNRFEREQNPADLQKGIAMFQRVAGNYAWWGGRSGSGAVVTYLAISVSRLRAECDVGAAQSQIEELWNAVAAITAEEADAALVAEGVESTLPVAGRFDVSRISLLASAASLLADDSRAAGWEITAEKIASAYQTSCLDLETYNALTQASLAYNIAKRKVPSGLVALFSLAVFRQGIGCLPLIAGYQTSGPVAAVTDGESLRIAIQDSEMVEFILDRVLSQFPPGSQCGLSNDDPDRTPIDVSR